MGVRDWAGERDGAGERVEVGQGAGPREPLGKGFVMVALGCAGADTPAGCVTLGVPAVEAEGGAVKEKGVPLAL